VGEEEIQMAGNEVMRGEGTLEMLAMVADGLFLSRKAITGMKTLGS
jgi:hypothetical protein